MTIITGQFTDSNAFYLCRLFSHSKKDLWGVYMIKLFTFPKWFTWWFSYYLTARFLVWVPEAFLCGVSMFIQFLCGCSPVTLVPSTGQKDEQIFQILNYPWDCWVTSCDLPVIQQRPVMLGVVLGPGFWTSCTAHWTFSSGDKDYPSTAKMVCSSSSSSIFLWHWVVAPAKTG